MPHSVASDLVLYCLLMSNKRDTRLRWVCSCNALMHCSINIFFLSSNTFLQVIVNSLPVSGKFCRLLIIFENNLDPDQA